MGFPNALHRSPFVQDQAPTFPPRPADSCNVQQPSRQGNLGFFEAPLAWAQRLDAQLQSHRRPAAAVASIAPLEADEEAQLRRTYEVYRQQQLDLARSRGRT